MDYLTLKEYIKTLNENNDSLTTVLILLVSVNIIVEVIRFISKIVLSNKDRANGRQLLIDENRIKKIERLFQSLDRLSLFDRNESVEMLDEIKRINQFVTKNKLYLSKKFQSKTNKILDYYKDVLTDYRNKDIKKETELINKFCDEFKK
jgi:hypothetical protein